MLLNFQSFLIYTEMSFLYQCFQKTFNGILKNGLMKKIRVECQHYKKGAYLSIFDILEESIGLVLQVEREQIVVHRLILRVHSVAHTELQVAYGLVGLLVCGRARRQRRQQLSRIQQAAHLDPQLDNLLGQDLEENGRISIHYVGVVLQTKSNSNINHFVKPNSILYGEERYIFTEVNFSASIR